MPEVEEIQLMTYRMEAELPRMLEDHRLILSALQGLAETAGGDGGARLARFAERFALHARAEEEVHFPAVMLLGEALNGKVREYHQLRRYYRSLEAGR